MKTAQQREELAALKAEAKKDKKSFNQLVSMAKRRGALRTEIVLKFLTAIYKDRFATDCFWGRSAICKPIFQENKYIKVNESQKVKFEGITFRYMATHGGMVATKSYQVLYKFLKH